MAVTEKRASDQKQASPDIPREEKKSRFDLRALLETSRLLIDSHDAGFILNNLLLISMGKIMASRAAILWFHPVRNEHTVLMKKGPFKTETTLRITRKPFKNRNTVFCDEFEELRPLCDQGISLLVTLKSSERHLGFLALGPKAGGKPVSPEEIEILESFAFMSGIAIANSELVGELKKTNRRLDYKVQELYTLFDLSKEFNASVDRDQITRLFKFTLLGQLFVRRFFLILNRPDKPMLVSWNGLGRVLNEQEMRDLFTLEKDIIMIDDRVRSKLPFLAEMQIHLLLKLHNDGGDPAIIGLGKRANGLDFEQTDFNFLISIGNLALMSIQKTYLLEDRIEKERLEEELHIARTIQQKLLPDNVPDVKGLDVAAKNVPSYQVGGDYYDLIRDERGALTMAIADVTGKGVPASLLMANLQSVLHVLHPFDIGMEEATGQINALIYQNTPSDKFISFFWGRYNPDNGVLEYVNAGHNPPLLIPGRGNPQLLTEGGVLLGAMPTLMPYKTGTVRLKPGDILVLYTDGITEAMNQSGEEYDETRLLEFVSENRELEPEALIEGIISDVKSFSSDNIGDDLTMIICKKA